MRKVINLTSLFVAMLLMFFACSKDDRESALSDIVIESEPKNTIDKIIGVWESLNNDLFFISISPQGKVSYCFSQHTMGIGYGTLRGKKLVIENDYSGCSDKLDVDITSETIHIRGVIKKRGTDENEVIMLSFKKVDEKNVYSFVGEFWKPLTGLHVIYGSVQETLSFISDNISQYRYYVVKTGKVLRESVWYYIPRKHHKRGSIIYVNKSISDDYVIQACDWWISDDLFYRK